MKPMLSISIRSLRRLAGPAMAMNTSKRYFTNLFWFLVFSFASSADGLTSEFTLPFERVTISMSMDESGWVLGHEKMSTGFTLIEWVPGGETVENWRSQFRALRYSNNMLLDDDASSLAIRFVETLLHRCDNKDAVHHEILESDARSALIKWEMEDCETEYPYSFDQIEMTRFIVGKEFTFNLAFTQNRSEDLQSGDAHKLLTEAEQLAALRSAVIRESKASGSMVEAGVELMKIPLFRIYAQFDAPNDEFGHIWLEEVDRRGTGRSTEVTYRLKSEQLPPDHWYAVYLITAPEGLVLPVQYGLKLGENSELMCPPNMEGMPAVESVTGEIFEDSSFAKALLCAEMPNRSINDTLSLAISDFQAGLAVAVAVQSHDANHRYLATAIPRPLQGKDADCEIGLELMSPDGRTYVLSGKGFAPKEILHFSWQYAKNISELDFPAKSDGTFSAPLFHSGEAKGRKKWRAEIHSIGRSCAPKIEYSWGKDGMRK